MKWSWKIAQIAGIGVHVHATFLLLVGLYAITGWARNGNAMEGMQITVFTLALFACIMLHELGHALTAKRFGIATRDITLLPIGGIARLERIPDEPRQELWIAAAGPIVSVMLATALYGVGWLGGNSLQVSLPPLNGALVQQLAAANLYLAVFNLIPAFPMDGGRILRALLPARLGRVRGTTIATRVGQAVAFLFGAVGLFVSPMLILIALFVWFSASQESAAVQMRTALDGLSVGQVMRSNVQVLVPSAPLGRAAALSLGGLQRDFPVVERGRLVGLVTRDRMLAELARLGPDAPLWTVMQRDFPTLKPSESANEALERMGTAEYDVAPVVRDGHLVGMLSAEGFHNVIALDSGPC